MLFPSSRSDINLVFKNLISCLPRQTGVLGWNSPLDAIFFSLLSCSCYLDIRISDSPPLSRKYLAAFFLLLRSRLCYLFLFTIVSKPYLARFFMLTLARLHPIANFSSNFREEQISSLKHHLKDISDAYLTRIQDIFQNKQGLIFWPH